MICMKLKLTLLIICNFLIIDLFAMNTDTIFANNHNHNVIVLGIITMENPIIVRPKIKQNIKMQGDQKRYYFRRGVKCINSRSFVIEEKNLTKINYKKKDMDNIIFDTLCYMFYSSEKLIYDNILPIVSFELKTIIKKTYPNELHIVLKNLIIEKDYFYKDYIYKYLNYKKYLFVLINVNVLKRDAKKYETEPCNICYALYNPANQGHYVKVLIPLKDDE